MPSQSLEELLEERADELPVQVRTRVTLLRGALLFGVGLAGLVGVALAIVIGAFLAPIGILVGPVVALGTGVSIITVHERVERKIARYVARSLQPVDVDAIGGEQSTAAFSSARRED